MIAAQLGRLVEFASASAGAFRPDIVLVFMKLFGRRAEQGKVIQS
jgi:hypothetical protein